MDDKFMQSFAEVIREQVSHKCEVVLEGIGMFRIEHQNQYQQQYKDGRVVMMPPKDVLKFTADNKWTNAD